jgi:hypothetical protein
LHFFEHTRLPHTFGPLQMLILLPARLSSTCGPDQLSVHGIPSVTFWDCHRSLPTPCNPNTFCLHLSHAIPTHSAYTSPPTPIIRLLQPLLQWAILPIP